MPVVNQMLDELDKHYTEVNGHSIFTVTTLKWFDPASGMGNFPVGVFLRLMDGLRGVIQSTTRRKKHNIEKMLYMSELNKKNVFICKQIFNIDGAYKMNLHEGDTLEMDMVSVWPEVGDKGFDVVMGNPPFNKGGIIRLQGDRKNFKTTTIWPMFVRRSFDDWLKPAGYLALITPVRLLRRQNTLHGTLLNKHIVWTELWDGMTSKKKINGAIPIALFVVHNVPYLVSNMTSITSVTKRGTSVQTTVDHLIPGVTVSISHHSVIFKLMKFIINNNLQLSIETKTVKSTGEMVRLDSDHTIEDDWAVDRFLLDQGVLVKKGSKRHPDADKPKLIIANKTSFKGSYIDNGRLGLTGSNKFYVLGNNHHILQNLLNFKIASVVCSSTKYSMGFLDREAFTFIPDIRKLPNPEEITEESLYEMIGLSKEEIESMM